MRAVVAALVVAGMLAAPRDAAGLDPALDRALATSTYVYVASERKGGTFGTPAEIWFMWDDGAVWVASPPTSWRAKRIHAGRTKARIAVGRKDGPTFAAEGAFVRDPAVYDKLCATFAKKYPDGWRKYEASFRAGLKDGSRVLMRYRPVADAPAVSASPPPPCPTAAR